MNSNAKRGALFFSLMLLASAQAASQTSEKNQSAETRAEQIESAFSPDAGAEALILKVIASAQNEIRLAAYSFTSRKISVALIAAKKRGVDVRLLVDEKRNRGKQSISTLHLLLDAGIPVRTISAYALHHDKYMVVDARHVQNGSFNYTSGAADENSENVIVVWNNSVLASSFLRHWQSRWEQATHL